MIPNLVENAYMTHEEQLHILIADVKDLSKPVTMADENLFESGNEAVNFYDEMIEKGLGEHFSIVNQIIETDKEIIFADIYSEGYHLIQ